MRLLDGAGTEKARGTAAAIRSGAVKVDGLSDLTRTDYRRLAKEADPRGRAMTRDAFEMLGDARSQVSRFVHGAVYGYMWDDRVYVSTGVSTRRLAATRVHEVNHVLNHSEEHYRGAKAQLVEEYRAHYAERVALGVEMTPERCRKLKQQIIREYALKGVTPDDVADVPPGRMTPDRFGRQPAGLGLTGPLFQVGVTGRVLNEAPRAALAGKRNTVRFKTFSMGTPMVSLDKALALAAVLGDDELVRKLDREK